MKYKEKTVQIKRAREAKKWRNFYFGSYLPMVEEEFANKSGDKYFNY